MENEFPSTQRENVKNVLNSYLANVTRLCKRLHKSRDHVYSTKHYRDKRVYRRFRVSLSKPAYNKTQSKK